MTNHRAFAAVSSLCVLAAGCVSTDAGPPAPAAAQTPTSTGRPSAWETPVRDGVWQNRGAARIGPLGNRWTLTVYCDGVHATYLDQPTDAHIRTAATLVVAQYQYVDVEVKDVRCVRAPCGPVIERRIRVLSIRALPDIPGRAERLKQNCNAQG